MMHFLVWILIIFSYLLFALNVDSQWMSPDILGVWNVVAMMSVFVDFASCLSFSCLLLMSLICKYTYVCCLFGLLLLVLCCVCV